MTQQVVSLKFHKVKQTSRSQHEPEQLPRPQAEKVKERVRSISRVFSRTQSDLPKNISFDTCETGRLGARPRSINRVFSRVFSLASEDGVVITSTRKVADEHCTKLFRLPSEKGVVITSARKVEEHQHDLTASDDSIFSNISSHFEDEKESDALRQVQDSDDDELLLTATKQTETTLIQTVQSKAKNEEVRNVRMFYSFCMTDEPDRSNINYPKDEETSIWHKFSVALGSFGSCSPFRSCFEGPICHEGEEVVIPRDELDDMSSLSGMSRFHDVSGSLV